MITLEAKIKGEKGITRAIGRLRDKLSDPRGVLTEGTSYLLEQVHQNFASQGALFGEPWPSLSPMTVKMKKAEGYPTDPLVRTGKMKRSFKGKIEGGDGESGLTIFNPTPYFIKHQSSIAEERRISPVVWYIDKETAARKGIPGGGFKQWLWGESTVLPRRVMLKFTKQHREHFRKMFSDWITRSVREAFNT